MLLQTPAKMSMSRLINHFCAAGIWCHLKGSRGSARWGFFMIKKLDVWTLHRARASHISVQNRASFRTLNAAHYHGKCISGLFKMHSRLCTSDRLWKSLVNSQKVDYKACELTKAFRHDFVKTSFTHYRSVLITDRLSYENRSIPDYR